MSLRKVASAGLIWTFTQQFGNQLVGFLVSLILARILLPKEFGLIGMIAVFVSVGQALIHSGLTQSLIRTKDPDQVDYSTVFFFNLATSIAVYLTIYFSAPLIADFYNQEVLIDIIRLYCVIFIINAFSAVQQARLTKNMDFKTQALIALPSTVLSGVLGISMAYMGYGVWSLVWSQISMTVFSTVQLWIYAKWSPSFIFSWNKFKTHFTFGYQLTLSSLLNKIFNNIYLIVIGRFFSATQVGFYTRAETMKQLPVTNISTALNKVTYPLFATIQEDDLRLKRVYKQLMQMVIYVIAPILIFLAVLAEPIFRFLFTEKWLPAVPYFQILCVTGILYPVHAYNLNVLKVKGRSDLYLRLALVKKFITVIAIVIGIQFGILGLLYAQVIISLVSFFINAYYTDRFINYSAWQQMKDILPILGVALIPGVAIFFADQVIAETMSDWIRIFTGGAIGLTLYGVMSYLFKLSSLQDIMVLVKNRML